MDKRGLDFIISSLEDKYSYNFKWLSRPIIQYPQDIMAMQEILWEVQPDLVIETGIAHGGSLIFYASILELIGKGEVLGIDIEIREHNRKAIEEHPMYKRIKMIEGSSVSDKVVAQVKKVAEGKEKIIVCLDSNHTHEHVLAELEAYAPLTSKDSYCVVFDTVIEDMPYEMFPDRPWGRGNNPKTAVWEYLNRLQSEGRKAVDGNTLNFEIDKTIENKLLITVAPDGYLKRVK
jgi:cephalosporin hydroxylase